jgi:sugar phosphate isomerase/epimerase
MTPLDPAIYICLNRGTAGGSLPLDQFVHLAAQAGFQGADVDLGYAQEHGAAAVRDLYSASGMKFGGWGPPGDWRGDAGPLADNLKKLDQQAGLAAELGIDACATWIMPSSDRPLIKNWAFHVERLTPIAKVLAGHGLRLGLEFVAPYHLRRKFPHEFIFTPGQMLELAADIGPNVGLLVDCFHLYTAGDTWDHLAKIPADKIVLAHLNDAPAGAVSLVEDGNRLLPGEGAIDARAYLAALQAAGYRGPVSLEVFSTELREMTPADAARRAWQATARAVGKT